MRRRLSEDGNRARRVRDAGMTLVEVLVAIVLLGGAVAATLNTLAATVIGTRSERDHSRAFQWLQSATGVLQAAPRVGCELVAGDSYASGEQKVRLVYQDVIRNGVINPPDWQDYQLTIVEPVQTWDGTRYWKPNEAPKPCYDGSGFKLQLITIQVTSPDGKIIETVQVVKDA